MEILLLLLIASLGIAGLFVLLFAWSVNQRTHDHADRLALLPLREDDGAVAQLSESPSLLEIPQEKPHVAPGPLALPRH